MTMALGPDAAEALLPALPATIGAPLIDSLETPYMERRAQLRARIGAAGIFKKSIVRPVDLGGCPRCGHLMYLTGGALFCPCEDCHTGGIVVR